MPSNTPIFAKYLKPVFIETGSYRGDGIQQALDAGFSQVYSIELSPKYYSHCVKRFSSNKKVTILKGDSFKILPDLIKDINSEITFWLDGHHSCGDTALGEYWAPLMQELDVIKSHSINSHNILIDDMRCWRKANKRHGFVEEDIINKIFEINSNYNISFEDGFVKDDILAAHLNYYE